MLSWRTAVIAGVLMLAFALIMPSLRVYFEQQEQLQELRTEAATAQTEVDDLHGEVARWDDPSFLVAQARERLAYVFPGETPYRVVDPETVQSDDDDAPQAADGAVQAAGNTWYDTLWGSMLLAGDSDQPDAELGAADDGQTPVPQVTQDGNPSTVSTGESNVDFSE
jgi:cell division protein FtsB